MKASKSSVSEVNKALIKNFGSVSEAKKIAKKRFFDFVEAEKKFFAMSRRQQNKTKMPNLSDWFLKLEDVYFYYAPGYYMLRGTEGAGFYVEVENGNSSASYLISKK